MQLFKLTCVSNSRVSPFFIFARDHADVAKKLADLLNLLVVECSPEYAGIKLGNGYSYHAELVPSAEY